MLIAIHFRQIAFDNITYPMAWHGTALNLSTIAYLVEYSVPDHGILTTFHIGLKYEIWRSFHRRIIAKAFGHDRIRITVVDALRGVPGHGIKPIGAGKKKM